MSDVVTRSDSDTRDGRTVGLQPPAMRTRNLVMLLRPVSRSREAAVNDKTDTRQRYYTVCLSFKLRTMEVFVCDDASTSPIYNDIGAPAPNSARHIMNDLLRLCPWSVKQNSRILIHCGTKLID